jgi:hypothetical protein
MTAFMAREFGMPVVPVLLRAADGNKIAVFVCGEPPQVGHVDRRYVELFVCGVPDGRGRNVAHVTGLSYTVWSGIESRLGTLSAPEVLEQIHLEEQKLEEAWRREREARFSGGAAPEEDL